MLESACVNHDVNALECTHEPLSVSHVPHERTQSTNDARRRGAKLLLGEEQA
jgi:hypothetical protein